MPDSGDAPALVAICGTPSPLTQWSANLVHHLASRTWGPHVFVGANSEAEFLDALDRSQGRPVVLLAHVPARALMDRIVRTFDRVLLVQDDPVDVIGYVRDERQLKLWGAMSVASQSLTTLAYLRAKLKPPEVRSDIYGLDVGAAARAICAKLGMSPPEAPPGGGNDERVLSRVLAASAHAKAPGAYFANADENEKDLIATACRYFDNFAAGRSGERFEWPIPMFLTTDKKGQPLWTHLGDEIDLTGPARIFVYGPFLHLPVGAWTLKATLQVAENLSGNAIQIDVTADERALAKVKAQLPKEGEFAFEINFAVDEPRDPMQLRIYSLEGAIEGKVRLESVELTRVE